MAFEGRLGSSGALGLAVGVLSVALVVAAMLYSPGPPPLELNADVVIHSRFYGMTVPAATVDVKNVRVVDLAAEPAWKPVTRTGGFGNPYYRAGTFRTANGRTINLFTTGTQRLVLLPPARESDTPVLLDVEKPDEFAARLREVWRGR
ncbi:MAG: hypothetical protein JNK87_15525 [Bryobacterales bacterium]|nr:hypothetical protein [Bryobacterales bacterium]